MTSGVYLIRCVPTQKMYIGSSKNVRERWTQHKCLQRSDVESPPLLRVG